MAALRRPALLVSACLVAASPAVARPARDRPAPARRLLVRLGPSRPAAAALRVAVAPGVSVVTPFASVAGTVVRVPHYIGPDGTYDEYADLVRSVNGTPCGQACTRRALVRWGYAPAD